MKNRFHKTLKKYLNVLRTSLRPSTVEIYKCKIGRLIDYLQKDHQDINSFEMLRRSPYIEGWLQSLMMITPPFKNNTRSQYIQCVRRFFNDIFEWGWPEAPPSGLIYLSDFPLPDKYLPKPIPHEIDSIVIKELQRIGGTTCLGLVLARWTGLRAGELAHLEMNCLVKKPCECYSLRVPLGKLHTERVIPIDKVTASLIENIKRIRGNRPATIDPETGRPVEFLFCNRLGRRVSNKTFAKRLKVVTKSLGITENVHPHRLRHTYATELLRCGVSLPGIMKLLGHRRLNMTMRYVKVTDKDLEKEYLKAATKVRQQYAILSRNEPGSGTLFSLRSKKTIAEVFDEFVSQVQAVRFDHTDPKKRKKLQRFVERLRRIQKELPNLVE